MGWSRWLVVIGVGACGRIGFDGTTDGGPPRDGSSDARPDASFTTRHWQNRNDGTPGGLLSPKLVYDDARGTVIMYGGDTPMTSVASMWELLPSGWSLLCDPCAPGQRFNQAMTYDVARDRIVLFGGQSGGAIGDHWEWDGTSWSQAFPSGPAPTQLNFAQMVYDRARATSVMLGGGGPPPGGEVYELDGATWTHPVPVVSPPMVGGFGSEAAYHESARLSYALGDNADSGGFRDDLWAWDGAAWTSVCGACSGTARIDASIVYDVALDRLLLVGGYGASGELNGTWVLAGGAWQTADTAPPARDSFGLAYDRMRDVIVMYGGNASSCGGNCAETWEMVPN